MMLPSRIRYPPLSSAPLMTLQLTGLQALIPVPAHEHRPPGLVPARALRKGRPAATQAGPPPIAPAESFETEMCPETPGKAVQKQECRDAGARK